MAGGVRVMAAVRWPVPRAARGVEVTADEVAASLRWATATLVKAATSGRDRTWDAAPAGDEEPPF